MDARERFLNACLRRPVDRPPVWFMRQAGRYLPEYREIRAKTPFMDLCQTPRLAAEVSLQPYRRFGLDAIIVFSDILVLPMAMGAPISFGDGGPVVTEPIRDMAGVEQLGEVDPGRDLSYLLQAIDLIGEQSERKAPIIGFSGGPFSLAVYLIEGRRSPGLDRTRAFVARERAAAAALLARLADAIVPFAAAQASAGADAFLLMDTYVGFLDAADYLELVQPLHRQIMARVREATGLPTMLYALGAGHLADHLAAAGPDVLGLDWRTDLAAAAARLGDKVALQGNLDPAALFAPPAEIEARVAACLEAGRAAPGYIFNLGHGMLPGTPVEHVAVAVEAVKRWC